MVDTGCLLDFVSQEILVKSQRFLEEPVREQGSQGTQVTNPAPFMGPECLPAWLEQRLGQANSESRQRGRWGGSKGDPAMAALSTSLSAVVSPERMAGREGKKPDTE